MAYYRKGLEEISNNVRSDFQSSLNKLPNRRDLTDALCKTIAGASYSWHSAIDYVLDQCFVDTMDEENLIKHGQSFGIERKQATKAHGEVTFILQEKAEVNIPIGTIIETEDGKQYKTTTSNTSDLKVQVIALLAGQKYNLTQGVELNLINPINGVVNAIVSEKGINGGVDIENIENLRERIKFRKRNPPRCGTESDYIAWAQEVAGVTRSWCKGQTPREGQVTVWFMTDGLTADGFPTEDKIQEVQDYIDELRPSEAPVIVAKPIKKVVDINITGLEPDTAENKSKIKARVQEFFFKQSTLGGVLSWNRLNATITNTAGVQSFKLTNPTDDVIASANELAVLGEITYGD